MLPASVMVDVGDRADPFVALDEAGLIIDWSPAAARILGWTRDQVLGQPFLGLLVPAGDVHPLQTVERQLRHADGSLLTMELTCWSVTVDHASQVHLLLRDVTARRVDQARLRDSEELLQLLVDGTREYAIFMLDTEGRIATWNRGAERIKGYSEAEAVGQHFSIFYMAEAVADGHPERELLFARTTGQYTEDNWRIRKDGSQFWGRVVITALRDETGELRGYGKVTRDLTDERRADLALRLSEERFRRAFNDAPVAVALLDTTGRHLQVNSALSELTGYSEQRLLAMNLLDLTHPDDRRADSEALAGLASGALVSHARDKRYLHADGSTVWVNIHVVPVRDADGNVETLLCHALDITQRRRYEQQLVELANHDPLTGLPNRTRFHQELQGHLDRCRRYGAAGAVLMLDLDHFKRVNDSLGHNAGDELIISMANVLRSRLRTSDVICRLGGDEFAILLFDGGAAEADAVATAIVDAIRQDVTSLSGSRPRTITASVGIAVIDDTSVSPIELLAAADLAMYDAKETGRDCFRRYSDEAHIIPRTKARMNWAGRIEAALENDGFELWAQPILDLANRNQSSHELLLRMRGVQDEFVSPGKFLYIAERLGLICEIDHWVTTRAIDLLVQLQKIQPSHRLEVNISGLSVGHAGLRNHIAARLAATGADPSGLIFEITETAAVERITAAREFAEHLRDLGCRFALDDFGAGFGSFYYLKHLPFDYIKIDGEFIANCATNLTDRLVIDSVVSICRGLGKQTIAEFVGDEATLQFLESRGVNHAQGYGIGRPVPLPEAFPELHLPDLSP